MTSEAERCAEYEKFKKLDTAFRAGDLAALRAAVDDPEIVPNGPMPLSIGPCLEYAIYHSPLSFIQTLLEIGADPNSKDHSGFPPLIAALSCGPGQR
ncbi:MAG TPA: ankyrin repeat domain-containing protein, partial [Candidatus Udaeobacter sp.]|nr:ankyrin repeat domain-containing protein [Candidatus Udaeobacter sp.]